MKRAVSKSITVECRSSLGYMNSWSILEEQIMYLCKNIFICNDTALKGLKSELAHTDGYIFSNSQNSSHTHQA